MSFSEIVARANKPERDALFQWVMRDGPFWEDAQLHEPSECLFWNDRDVSSTGIGEAAWRLIQTGRDQEIVSLNPSSWTFSPVVVILTTEDNTEVAVDLPNVWDEAGLSAILDSATQGFDSWISVEEAVRREFLNLTISGDAFRPISQQPFVPGAARQVYVRFQILSQFRKSFDADHKLTKDGHYLYQQFFTGKKGDGGRGAMFSSEADDQGNLWFDHPGKPREKLHCPWHGKIQTPQLRVHFSWPITGQDPVYVVYVGPKINKW